MTLTLRILNYDALENGGPLSITLNQSGCSVGRRAAMDWVLPDPERHISGHHFDISFSEGAYWLTDVSSNGTFLQGQRYRLEGPHRLTGSDQLLVGHYIIGVELDARAQPQAQGQTHGLQTPPMTHPGPAAPTEDADPWDFGPPLSPAPLATPAVNMPTPDMGDISQDFQPMHQPAPQPPPVAPRPLQRPPSPTTGDLSGGAPMQPPNVASPHGAAPAPTPFMAQPTPQPQPQPQPQPPQPAPPQTPAQGGPAPSGDAILHAFCEGAGITPAAAQAQSPEEFARMLGYCVRIATEEMMRMLQDRANVKHFTKGGERTMRSATGNNPLKFMPDTAQAIETLFVSPRDGFMTGPEGFENALKDLRQHQAAVFAALQPALAHMLEGLSPEEIEEASSTGGILGTSKRGKAWDLYVDRWDAKAKEGENGMLDTFLKAFSDAYAKASR